MEKDVSYGIIPLTKNDLGFWKLYLVKHKNGDFWGFPKGHKETHESEVDAAKRELFEETKLPIKRVLEKEPLLEKYQFKNHDGTDISKTVHYYLAEVDSEIKPVLQSEEILDGGWFKPEEAIERITFDEGKRLCEQVIGKLRTIA
ncbi:MAG: NUDIX domain-containing protein [Rhabdochlamydiaceae bacterium]|nr:NUDIX domain-containing protein [Candidatus Amphrikana amoebophyrae]